MNTKKITHSAFNYFGGKTRHLDWLLPYFPKCKHYIEPFCGSAVVFLNKKPDPIETINDIDGRVINFFKVLRSQPDELFYQLKLSPYSYEEFIKAQEPTEDDIERARRFFVMVMQSFGGNDGVRRKTSWRSGKTETRKGVSIEVNKWFAKIDKLDSLVDRLMMAQFENRDALYVIKAYDSPESFFYCDPPYIHESRTGKGDYKHELTNDQHIQLAEALNNIKGKAMISGYNSKMMNNLYPPPEMVSLCWKTQTNQYWKKAGFRSDLVQLQGN